MRSSDEDALLRMFRSLDAQQQRSLIDFVRFLASGSRARQPPAIPVPQPRSDNGSVVHAIKRLNRTYPMLRKHKLTHRVEQLLAQHMMQDRDACEVIEELETFYAAEYAAFADER